MHSQQGRRRHDDGEPVCGWVGHHWEEVEDRALLSGIGWLADACAIDVAAEPCSTNRA